ncbi:unnamed protein product [Tenebrio molitor]|jgi:hypothetical protein|nr:unnamed protein product [Tenebrio molitor]
MLRYFALLFLGLCSIKCVLAINCHATNLTALRAGNVEELTHELEDCNVYMTNMLRAQGYGNRKVPTNIQLRCYTVVVDTDRSDVVVKGCIPTGGCGLMKEAFKFMVQRYQGAVANSIQGVECKECDSSGCNSANSV